MFILQRYIIRQHVGPFFFGFFIITLLWILNILFTRLGHLLSRGLPITVILEFFLLNMAWIVALTLPMAVLMSTLMAFGQMSADLEITAIKSSGISFYRMLLPVIIVSILLCLFLIWFNNAVLPEANHQYATLARDIQKKRPTIQFEPGIIYRDIPNIHIMVQSVEEHDNLSYVKGMVIQDKRDPNKQSTIVAESGKIVVNEAEGTLSLTLYNGEVHDMPIDKYDKYTRVLFPVQTITLRIDDMILHRSESEYRSDREQSAPMMLKEIQKNKHQYQKQQTELNSYILSHLEDYFPFLADRADSNKALERKRLYKQSPSVARYSPRANLNKQLRVSKNISNRIQNTIQVENNYHTVNSKLLVEVHKKYSIPFACIVFVLVGAPLGVMSRHGGMAVGGGISLAFFLVYWAFLIGGEELADRNLLSPFWAMWLANILVGGVGIYLVILTVRESTFIQWDRLLLLIPKRWRPGEKAQETERAS
ncbi:LptF/LptG family permease [candidate division KSB1 bacterium]|nr:LptF/LptG family permease [candidate division KSB1 bacterium]